MKRGYWLAGILIVVALAAAALFLPSYFARQGVDRLIASLPAGTQLTYSKTGYSLLSHSFTLNGAVLNLADPAMTIEAGEIVIENGNPWLEKSVDKAAADPVSAAGATKIADTITVRNIHTTYHSLDVKIGAIRVDGAKLYLGELYTPLPPLKTDPSLLDGFGGASLRTLLQKAARENLAIAFDQEDLQGTTLTIDQASSGIKLVTQIADIKALGHDRGSQQDTTIDTITVGGTIAANNAIEVTVEKLAIGPSDYRTVFTRLRDGDTFETAFQNFVAIHEAVDKVAVRRNGADLLSIGAITLDSSANGGLNSVKSDLSKIVLTLPQTTQAGSLSILPQLGYSPAVFDASVAYQQDPSTGALSFSDTKIIMENGATITVDGSMIGPTRTAPTQLKMAGFTLTYLDNSLAPRLLNYIATRSGKSIDQIKAAYIQFLTAYENAHAGDAVVAGGAEALKTFITTPHQLILSVRPQQPIGRDDLAGMDPQTITRMLGLSLTAQ